VDKIFEKHDKDKSFTLELSELQQVLTEATGRAVTEEQAN